MKVTDPVVLQQDTELEEVNIELPEKPGEGIEESLEDSAVIRDGG